MYVCVYIVKKAPPPVTSKPIIPPKPSTGDKPPAPPRPGTSGPKVC